MAKTEFITSDEMAEMLGITPRTLENQRSLGVGVDYVKLGKRVVYTQKAFDEFVERSTIKAKR